MKSPSIRSPHRRGYMLMELVVTVALTSLVAAMATQLITRIFQTGSSLQDGEQDGLAVERAAARLRQDVERASALSVMTTPANTTTLNLGGVAWSTEANALVRTTGQQIDRYDGLPAAPALSAHGSVVTLQLGDADWAFAPLADVATGGPR